MSIPNFNFEKKLWKRGFRCVGGVDEVGRGCFAGPVVAGCVVFLKSVETEKNAPRIDDSKKLTPRQREKAAKWIKENALVWGIGEVPASLINRAGMGKATKIAFRKAVAQANLRLRAEEKKQIEYLLLDAFYVPYIRGLPKQRMKKLKGSLTLKDGLAHLNSKAKQLAIIDGDEKSVSIAAASIIAKVYRDKLMLKLSKKYKQYGWGRNKGYGTGEHLYAIKKFGLTRYHRKKFVETYFSKTNS